MLSLTDELIAQILRHLDIDTYLMLRELSLAFRKRLEREICLRALFENTEVEVTSLSYFQLLRGLERLALTNTTLFLTATGRYVRRYIRWAQKYLFLDVFDRLLSSRGGQLRLVALNITRAASYQK